MSRSLWTLFAAFCIAAPALADDKPAKSPVKEAAKEVGHAVGSAARDVGQGSKKVAKDVGKAVTEAEKETGHAFRDGAQEFKKAVHGEGSKGPAKTSKEGTPSKKEDK